MAVKVKLVKKLCRFKFTEIFMSPPCISRETVAVYAEWVRVVQKIIVVWFCGKIPIKYLKGGGRNFRETPKAKQHSLEEKHTSMCIIFTWFQNCRDFVPHVHVSYAEKGDGIYSLVQWIRYTFDAVWSKFDSIPNQKCTQIAGLEVIFQMTIALASADINLL